MTLEVAVEARLGALEVAASFEVDAGGLVLAGPNGAGKTTVLHLLLGLLHPRAGRIVLEGRVLFDAAARVDVPVEERGLGYVPQHYALFPHLTVAQNVAFGAGRGKAGAAQAVAAAMETFALGALASRRTDGLSGGERQRVALARALASQPRALLLDEPLAALDVAARAEVRRTLAEHLARLKLPALVVTHDPEDAAALGQRVAVLEGGKLTQYGTVAALAAAPASPFVARLFAPRAAP